MPDRDEYRKLVESRRAETIKARQPSLEIIAQSAVLSEELTGNPAWDRYLENIKALIEATEKQRDSWDAILHDPTVVNVDAMAKAKIGHIECQARIDAWNDAMALPGKIIGAGEKARKLLEKISE